MALEQVSNRGEAHLELNAFRRKHDCALVISGDSLEVLQRSAVTLAQPMMLRVYFLAKTNTLEFTQEVEELERER